MIDKGKIYQNVLEYLDKKGIDFLTFPGCAEAGYEDLPVLAANWNKVSDKFFSWLEGFFKDEEEWYLEWSDEWMSCTECGKAVRCVPNSYGWEPSYVFSSDGSIACRECWENCKEEIIEFYKNKTEKAVPSDFIPFLEEEDWVCLQENGGYRKFQTGFHQGMDDDPKKVAKEIQEKMPEYDYLFALTNNSQFYTDWAVFTKKVEKDI